MRTFPIRNLQPVVSRTDSTEIGNATTKAQNIIMRPTGGIKGPPLLKKLWEFGSTQTPFATLDALTHPLGGTLGASDNTVAIRIYHQGKSLLYFFNMFTGTIVDVSVTPGTRGLFYLGDDGSYSSAIDLNEGPPLYEVLAYGLDPQAMWYGDMQHGQLNCQNGVDDAIAVQLGRAASITPGKWRKRGTNAIPPTPQILMIEPQKSGNTQARRTITAVERSTAQDLVFTAHPDNFTGVAGNGKIKVRIVYDSYAAGIRSTISGDGTISNPYIYILYTSPSYSSNNVVSAFVNSDTKAIPILTCASSPIGDATVSAFHDAAPVELTLGAGTGDSEGLSNEVVDVYARYWDGGYANCGYEGPSSVQSNQIIIPAASNKDVLVTVPIDPTAEGGRFAHSGAGIRIYKSSGEETGAIWNLVNQDALLPNTYRLRNVVGDPFASKLWSWSAYQANATLATSGLCTTTATHVNGDALMIPARIALGTFVRIGPTNAINLTGTRQANDLVFPTTTGVLPGGMTAQDYYLRPRVFTTTFTRHPTTNEMVFPGSGLVVNDRITISNSGGALPGGLTPGDYYLLTPPSAIAGNWELSLTQGGAPITITSDGSPTNSATLVTNPNHWLLSLTSGGSGITLTSAGSGTHSMNVALEPMRELYVVGLATPTTASTSFALSYTPGGTARSICANVSTPIYALSAIPWTTADIIRLAGATAPAGASLATSYHVVTPSTYSIQISTERLGTPIVLTSNGSGDLTASVYAVTLSIGSTTEPGRVMSPDQNRPPPHRYFVSAGNFEWCAGIQNNESKVYSSKLQEFDELVPEGVELADANGTGGPDFISKSRGSSSFRVTGLWSDKQSLHVHCVDGIIIVDPTNTEKQQEPLVDSGMVNGACVTTGKGNQIIFLTTAADLMKFDGARYGRRASDSISSDAMEYISSYADLSEMEKHPERCSILHDRYADLLIFWIPASPTEIVGFILDERSNGITGPFTAPCAAVAVTSLEPARSQYILADKDGYLFYWDASNQGDFGDKFDQTAIALNAPATALPIDHGGYLSKEIEVYVDGVASTKKLWYAHESIVETGYIDLGDSGKQKKFCGIQFRAVSGSRCHVRVTLIGHDGDREVSAWYGDVGELERNRPHRVLLNIVDTAVKVRIQVFGGGNFAIGTSADIKAWILRDFELLVM